MVTQKVLELVGTERKGIKKIKEFRKECESSMKEFISKVPVDTKEDALKKAVQVVQKILSDPEISQGYVNAEPSHGMGHLVCDYLHALVLGGYLNMEPKQLLPGFISAALHDIGCTLMPRYAESDTSIRHAEAGGLKLLDIFSKDNMGLNKETCYLIAYSVMAHTNYLKPTEVKNKEGKTIFIIEPYQDMLNENEPNEIINLTRQADRLHLNGSLLVPRHYFTMADEHKDFADTQNFYTINYENAMRPLLRTEKEIRADQKGRTSAEHLEMYRLTQTNESPYGKFDIGKMVEIRDNYSKSLKKIIFSVVVPEERLSDFAIKKANELWTLFLKNNCGPTSRGALVARKLEEMFKNLPRESREAWARGFTKCMEEYEKWSREQLEFLNSIPKDWLVLPGITEDIREIIAVKNPFKPENS